MTPSSDMPEKVSAERLREIVDGCVAVPPGFPAEYALADLTGTARPLMITKPSRAITYIMVRENDPKPYLGRETDLRRSDREPVELGSILYAEG